MGYLSDFSNFDEGLVDVKLHEETILKNEIQDDTNFSKFEPIVLSLYPCLLYTSPSPRDDR